MRSTKFALAIAAAAMFGGDAYAQGVCVSDVPNPYRLEKTWAQFPDGKQWVGTNTVHVDRNDHVWVFDRCGEEGCMKTPSMKPIYELDVSGKVLRNFGAGLFIEPHGIATDGAGSVWIGDEAARDGKNVQITKLDMNGKVLLTLGKHFIQPTGVVIAKNGDIFATDGHEANYDNARVLKFSKDGTFIKAFGGKGSGPGQLRATHGLTMDSTGRIFVADRGNGRIAIFDQEEKFLAEWKQFGRPSGIFIDSNDMIYVTDTQSSDDKNAGPPPGYRYNPGCKQGIRVGSAKDGKVIALIPPLEAGKRPPEGVAADSKGNVYGATTTHNTVFKYVKVN